MKRLCLAIDLKAGEDAIVAYEHLHSRDVIPPAVVRSLRRAGIRQMELHRIGRRLFMIIDADDSFSMASAAAGNRSDPDVQAWNRLMATLQEPIAGQAGWAETRCVFRLSDHPED